MARVKLLGGIADGSVALVAEDVHTIFVPREWVRNGFKPVPMDALRGDDREKYIRTERQSEGCAVFVAASVKIPP